MHRNLTLSVVIPCYNEEAAIGNVVQAFRDGERAGLYSSVSREVIRAGPEERRANPRSSSAKLRWAVRS